MVCFLYSGCGGGGRRELGGIRSRSEGGEPAVVWFIFFFKKKTAYEMLRSLVGSEMCIRDRSQSANSAWILFQLIFIS